MYIYNWPQCRDFPRSFKHAEMLANKSALVLLYKNAHIICPGMGIYIPNTKYEQYLHIKVQTLFTLTRGHV